MKFRIDDIVYEELVDLAQKDYEDWVNISSSTQCKTSLQGCLVGVLSEYTTYLLIKDKLLSTGVSEEDTTSLIKMHGFTERMNAFTYHHKSDIEFTYLFKNYKVECKGCSADYPLGQITPYHLDKYIREAVDYVSFVAVTNNINKGYADCEVYKICTPSEITSWKTKPNLRGQHCHTHPDTIKQE